MRSIPLSALSAALALATAAALSQEPTRDAAPDPAAGTEHSGHGAAAVAGEAAATDDHAEHSAGTTVPGSLGTYPMSRDASGTSWQPEASPMQGYHGRFQGEGGPEVFRDETEPGAHFMIDAFLTAVHTDSTDSPRGDNDSFVQSMAMMMLQAPVGPGTLGLRGMFSLDPTLVGDDGYPLLFQTGETADGATLLIDRQHPHDLFMELAATYSAPIGDSASVFGYGALAGEPALGPVTFMHRASGLVNPEAPLSHHWLDSTHISFGVLTGGVVLGKIKLEASAFNGREPDENRYDIEIEPYDSWSARATWNPTPDWSTQVSYGSLEQPERLEPGVDIERTTLSAMYHHELAVGWWQTTLAVGRNEKQPGSSTDAWLLESAIELRGATTLFARAESVDEAELLPEGDPLHHQIFRVQKLGLGAARDFRMFRVGVLSAGIVYNWHFVPQALEPSYGGDPGSWLIFVRWSEP